MAARGGRRPAQERGWTRMMLFDAERIPAIAADPQGALRAKVVGVPARARQPAGDHRDVPPSRGGLDGHAGAPALPPAAPPAAAGRGGGRPPERGARVAPAGPSTRPRPVASVRPAGASRPRRPRPGPERRRQRPPGGRGRSAGRASRRRCRGGARRRPRRRAAAAPLGAAAHAMNFELTEDQSRIRDAVREFAETEIAPGVAEREKNGSSSRARSSRGSRRWGSSG